MSSPDATSRRLSRHTAVAMLPGHVPSGLCAHHHGAPWAEHSPATSRLVLHMKQVKHWKDARDPGRDPTRTPGAGRCSHVEIYHNEGGGWPRVPAPLPNIGHGHV